MTSKNTLVNVKYMQKNFHHSHILRFQTNHEFHNHTHQNPHNDYPPGSHLYMIAQPHLHPVKVFSHSPCTHISGLSGHSSKSRQSCILLVFQWTRSNPGKHNQSLKLLILFMHSISPHPQAFPGWNLTRNQRCSELIHKQTELFSAKSELNQLYVTWKSQSLNSAVSAPFSSENTLSWSKKKSALNWSPLKISFFRTKKNGAEQRCVSADFLWKKTIGRRRCLRFKALWLNANYSLPSNWL